MTKDDGPIYLDKYVVRSEDSCMQNTIRALKAGLVFGTSMTIFIAQPVLHAPLMEHVGRSLARCYFPSVIVSTMYASTTCLLDEVRGPRYPVSNGFLGGAIAGMTLATKFHSLGKVAYYGAVFGIAGMALRFAACGSMFNYSKEMEYREIDRTLIMSEARKLAPPQYQK